MENNKVIISEEFKGVLKQAGIAALLAGGGVMIKYLQDKTVNSVLHTSWQPTQGESTRDGETKSKQWPIKPEDAPTYVNTNTSGTKHSVNFAPDGCLINGKLYDKYGADFGSSESSNEGNIESGKEN